MNKTKLNRKEKLILELLNEDCNTPLKKISEKLNISKQAVSKRIKELEKGVIEGYRVILDNLRIGYARADIYLNVIGLPMGVFENKLEILKKNKLINWTEEMIGSYNLHLAIYYSSLFELNLFLKYLNNLFKKNIQKRKIYYTKKRVFKGIKFESSNERIFESKISEKDLELSEKEKFLIKNIKNNARDSSWKLAEKCNMSINTYNKTLNKLKKEKVILGQAAIINFHKLDYVWSVCIIDTQLAREIEPILQSLNKDKRVIYYFVSLENEIVFDFLSREYTEFLNFINLLIKEHGPLIKEYTLLNYTPGRQLLNFNKL